MVGKLSQHRAIIWVFWLAAFVASFVLSSLIASLLLLLAQAAGMQWSVQTTVGSLIFRLVMYMVMAIVLLGLPYVLVKRRMLSWRQLGLGRMLQFRDIGLALAGAIIYVLSTVVVQLSLQQVPGFNSSQPQDLGISTHLVGGDLLLAYIVLVILTPFFEEFIFRGVLYGELRHYKMKQWPAIIIVSALFGLAHGQWNVGLDVFCLSVVACYLRELTGTIWPGVVLHMLKNAVAFYFVFIAAQSMTG